MLITQETTHRKHELRDEEEEWLGRHSQEQGRRVEKSLYFDRLGIKCKVES